VDNCTGGPYSVTVGFGEHIEFGLRAERARRYANTLVVVAVTADHDAAVLRQLISIGIPRQTAAALVITMRPGRAPRDDRATEPFRFEPGVSEIGRPFVDLHHGREHLGQFDVAAALEHALAVQCVFHTVPMDTAYLATLKGIGLTELEARTAVGELGSFRSIVGVVGEWK
jgi:hypothetical protein